MRFPCSSIRRRTYRIEQILTSAVVRELTTRTQYKVLNKESGDADATLKGVVVLTQTAPVTYDSTTGRASTSLVTVSMKVTMTDKSGKVLFENPNYVFREEYQISQPGGELLRGRDAGARPACRATLRAAWSPTLLEGF